MTVPGLFSYNTSPDSSLQYCRLQDRSLLPTEKCEIIFIFNIQPSTPLSTFTIPLSCLSYPGHQKIKLKQRRTIPPRSPPFCPLSPLSSRYLLFATQRVQVTRINSPGLAWCGAILIPRTGVSHPQTVDLILYTLHFNILLRWFFSSNLFIKNRCVWHNSSAGLYFKFTSRNIKILI